MLLKLLLLVQLRKTLNRQYQQSLHQPCQYLCRKSHLQLQEKSKRAHQATRRTGPKPTVWWIDHYNDNTKRNTKLLILVKTFTNHVSTCLQKKLLSKNLSQKKKLCIKLTNKTIQLKTDLKIKITKKTGLQALIKELLQTVRDL